MIYPHLHQFAVYGFETRTIKFSHNKLGHTDAAGNSRTYTEADREEAQRLVDEMEANIETAAQDIPPEDRKRPNDRELIILMNHSHMFTVWRKKY